MVVKSIWAQHEARSLQRGLEKSDDSFISGRRLVPDSQLDLHSSPTLETSLNLFR